MSAGVFDNGGSHHIDRTGPDEYRMNVELPKDADGRTARECPSSDCSPGYFKVKGGTGITGGQEVAYCPYCRHSGEPNAFATHEQLRYAKDLLLNEACKGVDRMIRDAFELGSSGRRKLGGGFLSVEMSYKPSPRPIVRRPLEEELQRDIVCPHCTLNHSVYGLATWCADCGKDIFLAHVEAELDVVRRMLSDVDRRREQLGARIAAKDLENCLEDTVSIFEAALRALVRRHLAGRMTSTDDIDEAIRKIGNAFQSISRAEQILLEKTGVSLSDGLSTDELEKLKSIFEKRHPITHNLGVIDKKYLERVRSAEKEGREVSVTAAEVAEVLTIASKAFAYVHGRLFS